MKSPVARSLCSSLLVFVAACSVSTKGSPGKPTNPDVGSGDAHAKTPAGFTLVPPNYLGFKKNDTTATGAYVSDSDFADKQCEGQDVGAFFTMRDYSATIQAMHFCLGAFAVPERANNAAICVDCDKPLTLQNLYVAVTTDKGTDGVADVSFITVVETDSMVRGGCSDSSFGTNNLRSGYGAGAVSKAVLEQMVSLQNGHGLCSDVTLDDYHDLQNVTMASWSDRKASFSLSKIDLAGRP